jgi:hypothetical protein
LSDASASVAERPDWQAFEFSVDEVRAAGLEDADPLAFDSGLADLWTSFANEVLDEARESQERSPEYRIPEKVVVRALDTPVVNASSFWCEGDQSTLIILNWPLVVLLWEVSRLLAARTEAAHETAKVHPEETVVSVAETIFDWFRLSSQSHPVDLPLTPIQRSIATRWCRPMEEFLIAHELAHVMLGHHDACVPSRSLLIETSAQPALQTADAERLQMQEHEADVAGAILVLRRCKDASEQAALLEALQLFFRVWQTIEVGDDGSMFPTSHVQVTDETHPPASVREHILGQTISTLPGAEGAWEQCNGAARALGGLVERMSSSRERDEAALAWADQVLEQYDGPIDYLASAVPVPDYVSFLDVLGHDPLGAALPTRLAALARRVALREAELVSGDDNGAAGAQPDITQRWTKAFMQTKLVVSAVSHLSLGHRSAFLEMYERAGGTSRALYEAP